MKTQKVIILLEQALQSATFERAGFPQEVKDMTQLYRETWIIPKIRLALEEIKGEKPDLDWVRW